MNDDREENMGKGTGLGKDLDKLGEGEMNNRMRGGGIEWVWGCEGRL